MSMLKQDLIVLIVLDLYIISLMIILKVNSTLLQKNKVNSRIIGRVN